MKISHWTDFLYPHGNSYPIAFGAYYSRDSIESSQGRGGL
jgi:hypothetical protein